MSQENSELVYSFVWKIENLFLCNFKKGEFIKSPHFIVEALENSIFYVTFYPKGEHVEDYFSLHLWRSDGISNLNVVDFKFKVLDCNGKTAEEFEKNKKFWGNYIWGWKDFSRSDQFTNVLNYCKENALTLLCEISSKQSSKSFIAGCEARSRFGLNKSSFTWTSDLNNLPYCKESKKFSFLDVPMEIAVTNLNEEFQIDIFPAKRNVSGSKMIFCQFSLLDAKGREVLSKCDAHQFKSTSNVWKFPPFFTKQHTGGYRFTLRCDIRIANDTVISEIENYKHHPLHSDGLISCIGVQNSKPDLKAFSALQDDMQAMFALKKYCDVELQVDNHPIPAHKALLAARSPVFSAMFDQNMLENQTGIVVVQDMDAETLNSLLEFIYSGTVQKLDYESISDLLIAADKYQISSLKETCSNFLVSILSVLNVCDVLKVASMIGYSPLKETALNYMMDNHEQLMSSEIWPKWVHENNVLATEVLLKLTNFLRNKDKK